MTMLTKITQCVDQKLIPADSEGPGREAGQDLGGVGGGGGGDPGPQGLSQTPGLNALKCVFSVFVFKYVNVSLLK